MAHVALIWPRYHVGSFDDDAGYILSAKALLSGEALGGHLASGQVMVGLYPPGYPALLTPFLWLWPHSYSVLRGFSVACFAAVFPLTWVYLRRRGLPPPVISAVLLVMALGPPFATFGSMVMAEAPFLVTLLVLLLAVDRWRTCPGVLGRWGVAAIAAAAALIWLKQAGIGIVVGLILWLAVSAAPHRRARALAMTVGVSVTLVPVVVARLSAGIPVAGDRYSAELGGFYQGGLLRRLVDVLPHSAWHLVSTAVPATLVPYLDPLPLTGHWPDLWKVLSWHVSILVIIGAVAWARRYRDAAAAMAAVYLLESVLWPFVNERRAILLLPLLAAWYVTGAVVVWQRVRSVRPARVAGCVAAATLVGLPLVAQTPRDYLYGWNQASSMPGGSRYTAILAALTPRSGLVETDYRSTIALYTGHPTGWDAFFFGVPPLCYLPGVLDGFRSDHAGFLVVGDLNKAGLIDSPCLAQLAENSSWAVPLLHTARDGAAVFELVGPGTSHPGLGNLVSSAATRLDASGKESRWTWKWPGPVTVTQLTLGEAAARTGATRGVRVEIELTDGGWSTVARTVGGVGDGPGNAPFLIVPLPRPVEVMAVRVVVDSSSAGPPAPVSDLGAIGPPPASSTRS